MHERNWVCTTCSQTFTRRYGADRHIRNIHSGLAKKVSLIDYIIGRLSGEYSPADPSLFNRRKKQRHPFSHYDGIKNASKFSFRATADGKTSVLDRSIPDPSINDNNHKITHNDLLGQELYKTAHGESVPTSNIESHDRLSFKIDEIRKLWKQHFSSQVLDNLLRGLDLRVVEQGGDDTIVDQFLAELNKRANFMKALDRLSFPGARAPSPASLSQEQMVQQEPSHKPDFPQIPRAAATKLAEIEQLLKPYCPPTSVQNIITGLIKRYKQTGDYSIFDRSLENHRRNVERYYSRY